MYTYLFHKAIAMLAAQISRRINVCSAAAVFIARFSFTFGEAETSAAAGFPDTSAGDLVHFSKIGHIPGSWLAPPRLPLAGICDKDPERLRMVWNKFGMS